MVRQRDKNEELPRKENYEDESQLESAMWQYFADKVILTEEELEAYQRYEVDYWNVPVNVFSSEDFEIGGERYEVVVFQFPDDRPPHEFRTRIFVVKRK